MNSQAMNSQAMAKIPLDRPYARGWGDYNPCGLPDGRQSFMPAAGGVSGSAMRSTLGPSRSAVEIFYGFGIPFASFGSVVEKSIGRAGKLACEGKFKGS
jgi:hypothetical protein